MYNDKAKACSLLLIETNFLLLDEECFDMTNDDILAVRSLIAVEH